MPQFFYTFRPHPTNEVLFEDFLTLFLPMILDFPKFVFVVERDNTPEKHFHAVFETPPNIKDTDKLRQKFKSKAFTQFQKFLYNNTETNSHAFLITKIKKDTQKDFKYYTGYCYKEDNVSRRDTNLNQNEILDSLKYYNAIERININSQPNDWIYIKPNNIHMYVDRFIKSTEGATYSNFPKLMNKQGYSFNSISNKQVALSIAELKARNNDEEAMDEMIIKSHQHGANLDAVDFCYNDVNAFIIKLIKEYNIKDVPHSVKTFLDLTFAD